jgi:hypothetical protein
MSALTSSLKMKAVWSFETLVSTYKSTRRSNPKDQHRNLHRRENLKSHIWQFIWLAKSVRSVCYLACCQPEVLQLRCSERPSLRSPSLSRLTRDYSCYFFTPRRLAVPLPLLPLIQFATISWPNIIHPRSITTYKQFLPFRTCEVDWS